MSDFATPRTAAHRAPLFFTVFWSLLKFMSIEFVMPSKHLALCHPLLPSVFHTIRGFSNESVLPSRWPKCWGFHISCDLKVRSESESRSVVSASLRPCGLYSPWNSPGQNTGVGSLSLLQGSSQPRFSTLQADSLSQGKPENTGVGSLSFLQWIFPTQELNRGLLCCRRILYHLSCEGSKVPQF